MPLGRPKIVLLVLTLSAGVGAQDYKRVFGGDISGQYVTTGTAVEVHGWVWTNESGTYYNVSLPSARPKMRIDTAALSSEQRLLLTQKCFSAQQFAGGCSAIVRGVVAKFDDRPGLFAHTLELELK
jgi:hypothetical protein